MELKTVLQELEGKVTNYLEQRKREESEDEVVPTLVFHGFFVLSKDDPRYGTQYMERVIAFFTHNEAGKVVLPASSKNSLMEVGTPLDNLAFMFVDDAINSAKNSFKQAKRKGLAA